MAKQSNQKQNAKKKELTKTQRIEAKKAKQHQKSCKKDKKQNEDEDIESILQEFMLKDAKNKEISIQVVDQPTPRSSFSMTLLPNNEIMMFGGEYFDGDANTCFNDLYRWNIDNNEWRCIFSPNTPPPRCSHQALVYRDYLYIFGGEFATADQFYHYRDLWRINLKSNVWENIEAKDGPSARSGHRMVLWRNYLVVFGGFYEAARTTRWYNDLHIFSLVDLRWTKVTYPAHRAIPDPRSGCQLSVNPSKDTIYMYGGYAKVKSVGKKREAKVYSDLWALHMSPVLKKQAPTWERLSKKGSAPAARSGATVAVHKQRFILFGGVHDEEQGRHKIKSIFYNDLFVYDMDRHRWFEFQIRSSKKSGKRRRGKIGMQIGSHGEGEAGDAYAEQNDDEVDEMERMLETQFGYLDEEGNIVYLSEGEEKEEMETEAFTSRNVELEEEKDDAQDRAKVSKDLEHVADDVEDSEECTTESSIVKPSPRINPALFIRRNVMYVYGGSVEDGDREITFDDCWSLDLKRLDEWKQILPGTMEQQVWKGAASEEGSSSCSGDEEMDDDNEHDSETMEVDYAIQDLSLRSDDDTTELLQQSAKMPCVKGDRKAHRIELEKLQEQLALSDESKTPAVGENLRDFFKRTMEYWTAQVICRPDTADRMLSLKEVKREAFKLADERHNELLPVLQQLNRLEIDQKEAEALQQNRRISKHQFR